MVALREIFESLGPLEERLGDESALARQRTKGALELGRILTADFEAALAMLMHPGAQACDRRALVRCFGSVIDGLANALCTIGGVVSASEGRQLSILPERCAEPTAAILRRICFGYTTISRCGPHSPLSNLQARRWDELKTCLDIRNRVVHPETPSDLEISQTNVRLITEVASQFIRDFQALARWQAARPSRLGSEDRGAKLRRNNRRRGGRRFGKCPCGSGRKHKNCCRVVQSAA
jgi:hypothetical protein